VQEKFHDSSGDQQEKSNAFRLIREIKKTLSTMEKVANSSSYQEN